MQGGTLQSWVPLRQSSKLSLKSREEQVGKNCCKHSLWDTRGRNIPAKDGARCFRDSKAITSFYINFLTVLDSKKAPLFNFIMKMWQVHPHNFVLNSPFFLHSFYPYGISDYSVSGPSKKSFQKQKRSSSVPSVFWKSYFFTGLVFIFITTLLQTEGIQHFLRVTPRELSLHYKLPLQLQSAQLCWNAADPGHSLRGLW